MPTTTVETPIQLAHLSMSPLNARTDTEYDVDAIAGLAQSISTVGLIHPLVVHAADQDGEWLVVAGGRRLAALKHLVEKHDDFDLQTTVNCSVIKGTDEELIAVSNAENFVREPMTDVEIYRAVQAAQSASDASMTNEMWAQAFGISEARMQRISRLANIHPEILTAYERGAIQINTMKALAGTPDLDEQKVWFDKLTNNEIASYNLKEAMGFGEHDTKQSLKFVGVDTYLEAGGKLEKDLFGEDADARVCDPELLAKLKDEKLEGERDAARKETGNPDLEFVHEAPGGENSYTLQVPFKRQPEVQEEYSATRADAQVLGEALDDSDLFDPELRNNLDTFYNFRFLDEAIADEEIEQLIGCHAKGKKVACRKALQELNAKLKRLEELEAKPPVIPATAVCFLTLGYHAEPIRRYYFKTLTDAGRTDHKPEQAGDAPAKPGEEGFDADSPPLTGRAQQNIAAIRSRTIERFLRSDQDAASVAHTGLIWLLARETHKRRIDNSGLVAGFSGATFHHQGTDLYYVGAPDVPGFDLDDEDEAWSVFRDQATPEDLEQLAAWVFACKVNTLLHVKHGQCVSDALRGLQSKETARLHAQPDMTTDFFGVFTKKVLAAFAGKTGATHSEAVMARKGTAPAEYMENMHKEAELLSPAAAWLPSFFRWGSD